MGEGVGVGLGGVDLTNPDHSAAPLSALANPKGGQNEVKSNHLLGSLLILDKLSLTHNALGRSKEMFAAVCNSGKAHTQLCGVKDKI